MMLLLLLLQLNLDSARADYMQRRDVWQSSDGRVMYDTLVGWITRPNLDIVYESAGEFHTRVRTDSEGFRANPHPPGSRLVLVGDSFVFGWGVEDGETVGALLSARNVSCPGWNTYQQLNAAKRWAERHDPNHELIYVLLWNQTDEAENKWLTTAPVFSSHEEYLSFLDIMKGGANDWLSRLTLRLKYFRPFQGNPIEEFKKTFRRRFVVRLPLLREVEAGEAPAWSRDLYYLRDGHLNAAGHRHLARLVSRVVFGM